MTEKPDRDIDTLLVTHTLAMKTSHQTNIYTLLHVYMCKLHLSLFRISNSIGSIQQKLEFE